MLCVVERRCCNVDSRARFTLTSEADSTTRHDTTRHDKSEGTLPLSSPVNITLYERSRKSRRTACRAGGDALSLATINRASSSLTVRKQVRNSHASVMKGSWPSLVTPGVGVSRGERLWVGCARSGETHEV